MDLSQLKRGAVGGSLGRPTTLRGALLRLGFVQADPIRSPARAQDLILRHRVKDYRVGDLERRYSSLGIEEDFLYAYGFMTRSVWELLHPRDLKGLDGASRKVLEIVSQHERIHPRALESYFGRERQVNDWGGYSKTTTRILHRLHYRGLIRVAGRENGIRLYEAAGVGHEPLSDEERLRLLVLRLAGIFGPVSERCLRGIVLFLRHGAPSLPGRLKSVAGLLKSGDLETEVVDGVKYVWPAGKKFGGDVGDVVRFLAPFDPVVWDRRRFEHLWGWGYRFEAYTPLAKRKMGYYAMPLLWREEVVGWVNVSNAGGNFRVETGFAKREINGVAFRNSFEKEVEAFRGFLVKR